MPAPFVSLLVAKAKMTGAALVGGVIATAALGGGTLALHQVADTQPVVVVSPTDSALPTPTETESPEAPEAPEAPDTDVPDAVVPAPAVDPAETADPAPAVEHVAISNATVTSIDAQSLVVTVGSTTYTWVLDDLTHFSGFFKNPADIKPGMVVNVQGSKTGDLYTALHVVTPGANKKSQPKAAKPHHAKSHAKSHKTAHGKGNK